MNNAELQAALLSGCPVEYKALDDTRIKFKCVTAIIYRQKKNSKKLDISAEVKDSRSNSVCIVDPKRLREVSANDVE